MASTKATRLGSRNPKGGPRGRDLPKRPPSAEVQALKNIRCSLDKQTKDIGKWLAAIAEGLGIDTIELTTKLRESKDNLNEAVESNQPDE